MGSGVNHLEVNPDWDDTTDSLSLIIYTPGGSNLGTYYDRAVDGRTHLDTILNKGYVESE